MQRTAYLAPEGFDDILLEELGGADQTHDRLLIKNGPPVPAAWAQNIWHDPVEIAFDSISDAAQKLRAIQRNWISYQYDNFRRAALITEKLPHISAKPMVFPSALPASPLGGFMLLDKNRMLVSAKTTSPFPNGELHFVEDKENPPNRAYLKLWEAFTLAGKWPQPGERCVDLGACPGGWSWVMAALGAAEVVAVDKAPLADNIAKMRNITFRQESAFGLDPKTFGKVNWMCCDIACYPERLLTLVEKWLAADMCRNFICTLKFQAETNHDIARKFAAIPGSRLLHLFHNKHELTWIKLEN